MQKKYDEELVFPREYGHERIISALKAKGYSVTEKDAEILWNSYSHLSSANWLNLDSYSDERIFKALSRVAYFEGLPNEEQGVLILTKG